MSYGAGAPGSAPASGGAPPPGPGSNPTPPGAPGPGPSHVGSLGELQLYCVLQRANLLQYYDTFISQGGDDVQQLLDAGEEEFLEIMALVGMASKPLHVRRLQKVLQEFNANPTSFLPFPQARTAAAIGNTPMVSALAGALVPGDPGERSTSSTGSAHGGPGGPGLSNSGELSLSTVANAGGPGSVHQSSGVPVHQVTPPQIVPLPNFFGTTGGAHFSIHSSGERASSSPPGGSESGGLFWPPPPSVESGGGGSDSGDNTAFSSGWPHVGSPGMSGGHGCSPVLSDAQIERISECAREICTSLPHYEPKLVQNKKKISKELLDVMNMPPECSTRTEAFRRFAAIYGRFDAKRKADKPLTLHEVSVNEAAAQICLHRPQLLTRRDELFPLARQVVKDSGYQYAKALRRGGEMGDLQIITSECSMVGSSRKRPASAGGLGPCGSSGSRSPCHSDVLSPQGAEEHHRRVTPLSPHKRKERLEEISLEREKLKAAQEECESKIDGAEDVESLHCLQEELKTLADKQLELSNEVATLERAQPASPTSPSFKEEAENKEPMESQQSAQEVGGPFSYHEQRHPTMFALCTTAPSTSVPPIVIPEKRPRGRPRIYPPSGIEYEKVPSSAATTTALLGSISQYSQAHHHYSMRGFHRSTSNNNGLGAEGTMDMVPQSHHQSMSRASPLFPATQMAAAAAYAVAAARHQQHPYQQHLMSGSNNGGLSSIPGLPPHSRGPALPLVNSHRIPLIPASSNESVTLNSPRGQEIKRESVSPSATSSGSNHQVGGGVAVTSSSAD